MLQLRRLQHFSVWRQAGETLNIPCSYNPRPISAFASEGLARKFFDEPPKYQGICSLAYISFLLLPQLRSFQCFPSNSLLIQQARPAKQHAILLSQACSGFHLALPADWTCILYSAITGAASQHLTVSRLGCSGGVCLWPMASRQLDRRRGMQSSLLARRRTKTRTRLMPRHRSSLTPAGAAWKQSWAR